MSSASSVPLFWIAIREIKLAGVLARAAHASLWGMCPLGRLAQGQKGLESSRTWRGQSGPTFLPSPRPSDVCLYWVQGLLHLPPFPGLHWRLYQGIGNVHMLGSTWESELMTKLSLRSYKPICGSELSPGEGIHVH